MSGRPFTIVGAIVAVLALGLFIFLGSRGGASPVDVNAVPPQSFDRIEQLKGLIPVVAIYQNQPVTGNLLVTSSDQVTGAQAAFLAIPKGYVAVTIPTGEQQGVAGFIQPGDYIAIQAIMAHGSFANTRTIYTNVHVLRTGVASVNIAPVQNGKGAPPPSPTVGVTSSLTVVVTQCQAEYINWFLANGAIKYTLESYKDYTPRDIAVDSSCPNVDAAGGVTINQVTQKWPGFLN